MPRYSACNQSIDLPVCNGGNRVVCRTAAVFQKRGKAAISSLVSAVTAVDPTYAVQRKGCWRRPFPTADVPSTCDRPRPNLDRGMFAMPMRSNVMAGVP